MTKNDSSYCNYVNTKSIHTLMKKILPVAEPCPICFSDDIESFVKLDCTHSLCDICYEEWHIKKKKIDVLFVVRK